jgi:hypothetical protein
MPDAYSTGIEITAQLSEGYSLPMSIAESSIRIVSSRTTLRNGTRPHNRFPDWFDSSFTERVRSVRMHANS